MSKIGKQPVAIPAGVTVTVNGQSISVKGPKGELSREIPAGITATVAEGKVVYERKDDSRLLRSLHGLSRTLCANMVEGVTKGYKKSLSIEGTGFKAQQQGEKLLLSLGFASPKEYAVPAGIKVTLEKDGVIVHVEGIDKELVGQAAARIRSFYPAEPYKGKGVKYVGEVIRRKQGKKMA